MKKFLLIATIFVVNVLSAQEIIPLSSGPNPTNEDVNSTEVRQVQPNGIIIISNITRPTLEVFLPPKDKANGVAVIVCPGGGYAVNAIKHEGTDVAKKLNESGIAAFVLKYRLPDDATMKNKTIAPLQDAQKAIKTVRDNAVKWGISPNKIGIMGFSAGGHLASTAGTHYQKSLIENNGHTSLRPDFMILIYPVISFADSIAHIGSRENLIGKNASEDLVHLYSNELQVTDSTPPAFLVHASDDDAVKPANSIHFYEALIAHKVPAELHIYERGGHGFGLINPTTKELWMDRCINWLAANGWL